MIGKRIINGKEVEVQYPDRFDWVKNLEHDALNSDTFVVKEYKRAIKYYRKWRSRINMFIKMFIVTVLFHLLGINNIVKDNSYYIDVIFYLTLVTFVGIFFPTTISEEISKKDVKETIIETKKEEEENKKIVERSKLSR